jgi:magnesium transporter
MDDDGDMTEMYLTEKKMRMEAALLDDDVLQGVGNNGFGSSLSAQVLPEVGRTASRASKAQLAVSAT